MSTTLATAPESQQRNAQDAIWAAIASAVKSATHLQVVTMLGDATVTEVAGSDGKGQGLLELHVAPPNGGQSLATNIDLALGDIAQTVSPALMQPGQEAVLALHQAMVEKGQAIVQQNLTLLKEMAKELWALRGS